MHNFMNFLYVLLEMWPWLVLAICATVYFTRFSGKPKPRRNRAHSRPTPQVKRVAPKPNRENQIVGELVRAGLFDDAELLEKLFADRDAIVKFLGSPRARTQLNVGELHELVRATIRSALHRAEDLLDYERRLMDPLLSPVVGGSHALETAREDVQAAYVAIADTRTRVRQHLAADRSRAKHRLDYAPLRSLVATLESETEIARRVEARMAEFETEFDKPL